MALTLSELDEIRETVARKGWLNVIHHPEDGELVERIVSCSGSLNKEQRELFVQLIDVYLYIPEVRSEIYELWNKIRTHCKPYDRVFLTPLKKKGERGMKSGDQICYVLASLFPKNDPKYVDLGTPFSDDIKNSPKNCVVFVDDFMGTGETLEECHKAFSLKNPGLPIIVAAIVSQETGVTAAGKLGIEVITNHVRGRTISDGQLLTGDIEENLRIYKSIEGSVDVPHDFRLGYGASEATVTVSRTPDNTLPIFWTNASSKEFAWLAPFPRR